MQIGLLGTVDVPFADDDEFLHEAMQTMGVSLVPLNWHDLTGQGHGCDALMMRSAWDFADSTEHTSRFATLLHELERMEAGGVVVSNPARLMQWGFDKFYLRLFQECTLPTVYRRAYSTVTPEDLAPLGRDWMVKPQHGCNSQGVGRFTASRDSVEVINLMLEHNGLLIQPFEPGVAQGELSLIFIGPRFSHAVLKVPQQRSSLASAPLEWRVQEDYGGKAQRVNPPPSALSLARRVARKTEEIVGVQPDYMRVDLICTQGGEWKLIEISMLEETLYFQHESLAAYRLARRVLERLPLHPLGQASARPATSPRLLVGLKG